jgi:four helix bundle protein
VELPLGSLICEAIYAESRAYFKHKLKISRKEISESIYWLELLKETDYLTNKQFEDLNKDAVEIIKMLTAIIKSTKSTS